MVLRQIVFIIKCLTVDDYHYVAIAN